MKHTFSANEKLALIELMGTYNMSREEMSTCFIFIRERFNADNHNGLNFEAQRLIRLFLSLQARK